MKIFNYIIIIAKSCQNLSVNLRRGFHTQKIWFKPVIFLRFTSRPPTFNLLLRNSFNLQTQFCSSSQLIFFSNSLLLRCIRDPKVCVYLLGLKIVIINLHPVKQHTLNYPPTTSHSFPSHCLLIRIKKHVAFRSTL